MTTAMATRMGTTGATVAMARIRAIRTKRRPPRPVGIDRDHGRETTIRCSGDLPDAAAPDCSFSHGQFQAVGLAAPRVLGEKVVLAEGQPNRPRGDELHPDRLDAVDRPERPTSFVF